MTHQTRPAPAPSVAGRLAIADCDVHPARRSDADFDPWLAPAWREHLQTYGARYRQGWQTGPAFPKAQPNASRRDAWPPEGGRPGSSLAFMQEQHLDPNRVALGILNPLGTGQGLQNTALSAALCHATNEWQIANWTSQDARLRASVVVPYEDAAASAKEIARCAGNPAFAQVLLLSRTAAPLGSRPYWPIYEAAAEAGLPVAIHAFGYGGNPITGGGWPSFYIEEMTSHAQTCQAGLASLIVEGVLARLPRLRIIIVEGGFGWAPALGWRLDRAWRRLRSETPHLDRLPSAYLRSQVWFTTQPMEEPEPRAHLLDTIEWIGWDRLLFATDYPHWDYDDPAQALPLPVAEPQRHGLFLGNARAVYGYA